MGQVTINKFLRGNTDPSKSMPGCANYDYHHGGCLFMDECLVEQGKRCGYFERAVLPTATDIGQTANIYSLYEKQTGIKKMLKRQQSRVCPDCGIGLKPRQRYCDKCSRFRRRQTQRENQRRFRRKVSFSFS